jgi:CheY-like chemotaxis protein
MPRILSLNDSVVILKGIHYLLNVEDYQHQYTTDSYHALSILRQERIDLFIQDMLRPDMNGFELYWLMKSEERLRAIPILIFSAWSSTRPAVAVTPVKLVGKTFEGLYQAKFEGAEPKDLIAVAHIKDANVLYIEGYLEPFAASELLDNVSRILKSQSLLTEEERAIRHQRLWSQVHNDSAIG